MRMLRTLLTALVVAALALASAPPARALEVGKPAPDFSLNGPEGKPISLKDLTARGPVVIYTFVAAFTPT